jgi:Sulfotransferase domain
LSWQREIGAPVMAELDAYLSRFRDPRSLSPPVLSSRPAPWRRGSRKSKLYYLLQGALPPAVFDVAVTRPYTGARRLARRNPGRGRILPDFLVIGTAKCGTTSLFDWLGEHPSIRRPTTDGHLRKELLFFDYNHRLGADWYRGHFATEGERRAFERDHGHPFLTGEATASYLTSQPAPARVAKLLPGVKLIALFRDPVDRAYSAFQMSRREGLEPCEQFESAIAAEAERLAPELARERTDPRYNPKPPPLGFWSYLHRSRYADHVARWLGYFPREQFLFLRFEDLVAEPQMMLDRVYEFLGVPLAPSREFPKRNWHGDYGSMEPETRAVLSEYFRPYNQRLSELTGVEFSWETGGTSAATPRRGRLHGQLTAREPAE